MKLLPCAPTEPDVTVSCYLALVIDCSRRVQISLCANRPGALYPDCTILLEVYRQISDSEDIPAAGLFNVISGGYCGQLHAAAAFQYPKKPLQSNIRLRPILSFI